MINLADAWRPIVPSSCPQGGLVECPHLRTVLGSKRDVHRFLRTITGTEPELWSFLAAESRPPTSMTSAMPNGFSAAVKNALLAA
jgi:hypothetical protein